MISNNPPAFIRRASANFDRLEVGYFSIIDQLTTRLWGRFEFLGHILADQAPNGKEIRPDISVGRVFSSWLEHNHPTVADNYLMYWHWTPDKEVKARQYPYAMLELFLIFLETEWIPNYAETYFRRRDPGALPHVKYLLRRKP